MFVMILFRHDRNVTQRATIFAYIGGLVSKRRKEEESVQTYLVRDFVFDHMLCAFCRIFVNSLS